MERLKSFLVCLVISIFFIYGFGIQGIQEQELASKWPLYSGEISKSWIKTGSHLEGSAHYDLNIEFTVHLGKEIKTYSVKKTNGTNTQIKKLARTTYAQGQRIELHINPENSDEFVFKKHHGWGPYILGFLPGLFFLLLGLKALFL